MNKQTVYRTEHLATITPVANHVLQRAAVNPSPVHEVPPIVHEVMRSPGQPLDSTTRAFMDPRFRHDFSNVRVQADAKASQSARAVDARAYTVGQDVVFGAGEYAPGTFGGQRLLAHELTHVVQQGANGPATSGGGLHIGSSSSGAEQEARLSSAHILTGKAASPGAAVTPDTIQRDEGEGSRAGSQDELRLHWPGREEAPLRSARLMPNLELRLDPEIQAQITAMRVVREMLDPDSVRSSLLRADFSSLLATQPPPWLTAPPTPTPAPLVPQGAGPSTPRAATAGDVAEAMMRIPAVDSALTSLRTQAAEQARADWRRLSTGERALVITQSALITGGALAGVLSSAEGREFSLSLIQNRTIPIPGVPGLTFQFNVTGPNQMLRFDLNVGALLPPSLGFR